MANFKALSSGFVFGTVLLLLLVVINVYAAAAAASNCNNSSEVMLFKSSPLKVVEEVAKDQLTTKIAIDDHHEIQGRVLQGIGGQAWKLINKFKSPFKGKKPAYKIYEEAKNKIDLTRDIPDYVNNLKNYLDSNYCVLPYCYPSTTQPGFCQCQEIADSTKNPDSCYQNLQFYCCQGTDATCSDCCAGKDGYRDILGVTASPSSTTPTGVSSISSSQSPIAYVAMAVIASFILVLIQGLPLI